MNAFTLSTQRPLTAIRSPGGHPIRVTQVPSQVVPEATDQAIESLQAISRQLDQLENLVSARIESLQDLILGTAVEIAQSVLQSDQDLIEQRVKRYAKLGMESVPREKTATAHVHPSCVTAIQQWLDEESMSYVTIIGDPAVRAGDCRIESDQTGCLIELEANLTKLFERNVTL